MHSQDTLITFYSSLIIQSAHFATIEIKDYYRRKESGNNPRRQPLAVFSLNSNTISLNLIPSVHPHSFRERQKLGRQQLQPFSFILFLLYLFLTPTAFLLYLSSVDSCQQPRQQLSDLFFRAKLRVRLCLASTAALF